MLQKIDTQNLEKDARGMFSEDGLLYVFCGLLLLLIGAAFAVPALVPFVGFSAFLIYPVEILRRRLTYPRIGYARFAAPPGAVRGILVFAVLTAVALATLAFAGDGRFQRYLPLAFSIVFGLAFYFGMSAHGMHPGDWSIILVTFLTGLFTTWFYTDWHDSAAALFLFVGGVVLVFGLAKLAIFLHKYPPIAQGEQE